MLAACLFFASVEVFFVESGLTIFAEVDKILLVINSLKEFDLGFGLIVVSVSSFEIFDTLEDGLLNALLGDEVFSDTTI